MPTFKMMTVEGGSVTEGVVVEKLAIKGAGVEIPAILIGEEGRNRHRGVLPVDLPATLMKEWQEKGRVKVVAAEVGTTKAGKPKLFAREVADSNEKVILVMPTSIGYRGGNSHTGDRTAETFSSDKPEFLAFPGEILVDGYIAQGDAGRMGGGNQYIVLMPKDTVFRTSYSGRLYGSPSSHYYMWDGVRIMAATWDERVSADIF